MSECIVIIEPKSLRELAACELYAFKPDYALFKKYFDMSLLRSFGFMWKEFFYKHIIPNGICAGCNLFFLKK